MIFTVCSILFFAFALSTQAFNAGVDDPCSRYCDSSYKNPEIVVSCKDGCKAFFLENNGPDRAKQCAESCVRVYIQRDLSDACMSGCKNQTIQADVMVSFDSQSKFFPEASVKIDSMLDSLTNIFNKPMSSMGDDLSQMFKNMQQQMQRMLSFGDQQRPVMGEESMFIIPEKSISAQKEELATVGNKDNEGEPVVQVEMIPIDQDLPLGSKDTYPVPVGTEKLFNNNANNQASNIFYEEDVLSCLSRRINHFSMLTRWMLCLALMLSIVSMVWICMAILRAKPRRSPYMAACGKGVDNVYYATPPFTVSDKSPMMFKTTDYKAQPEPMVQSPPPPYDSVASPVKNET